MSKTKLLPCPFCGSSNLQITGTTGSYQEQCIDCGATGPYSQTQQEAKSTWNKRPKEIEPEVIRYTRDVDPSHG